MNFQTILDWVLARLSEKSTWAALVTFAATITGRQIVPEFADTITTAGLSITALILAAVKTKPTPPPA